VTASGLEPPSDLDLVREAQRGDAAAFGELVERNRRAVFRAALAATGSASEADDVTQDTFVTAFRKLGSFRAESAFRTWLLAIAWRKATDRRRGVLRWLRRTRSSVPADGDTLDAAEQLPAPGPAHDEALAAVDMQRMVRRLIAALPRKLRDALLLAGSGEYTYDQIAAMLGAPAGTVKWRVAEARRILREKLEVLGYGPEVRRARAERAQGSAGGRQKPGRNTR
jgi:RNA polymerase sigma-70 factor (ECF subfamily)